jgi:hypothetical protein
VRLHLRNTTIGAGCWKALGSIRTISGSKSLVMATMSLRLIAAKNSLRASVSAVMVSFQVVIEPVHLANVKRPGRGRSACPGCLQVDARRSRCRSRRSVPPITPAEQPHNVPSLDRGSSQAQQSRGRATSAIELPIRSCVPLFS